MWLHGLELALSMGGMNPSCLYGEMLMHGEGKNGSGEFQLSHIQLKHAGLFVEVEYFTHFGCLSQNTIF